MIKYILTAIVFVSLCLGCNQIDIYPDNSQYPEYPTTLHKLPAATLLQKREGFASDNIYLMSSLTDYGFCGFADDIQSAEAPAVLTPFTEAEAVEKVNNFVSAYPSETGVKNSSGLSFYQIDYGSDYYDGSTSWTLKSDNQKIDTIEVLNSSIGFVVKNREIISCLGNWFPKVCIPGKFNVTREMASSSLLNHVIGHSTIAGQIYKVTISEEDLRLSKVNLKILPIISDDRIELRVCWQFDIPGPVSYKIFVDVITGKIVEEWPTIIS
jgi:hypothetical protein